MRTPSASEKPRIGLPFRTAHEEKIGKRDKYVLYVHSIELAGGTVEEISLTLDPAELKRLAASLDAFVLPGSPADVNPTLYGAARHAATADADADRERTDYALIEEAFAAEKPLLAICYGAQILNVCLGGTLYQDIASELHSPIQHSRDGVPREAADPLHPATIEAGGELGQLAAESTLENRGGKFAAEINTSHHQSIRDVGRGLRLAAVAPDGVIEAVENEPHKHWVVGAQWHPERMPGDALSEALFRALVQATRAAAARH